MWTSLVRRIVFPATVAGLLLPGSVVAQQYHRTDLTANSSAASATAPNPDTNLVNACTGRGSTPHGASRRHRATSASSRIGY